MRSAVTRAKILVCVLGTAVAVLDSSLPANINFAIFYCFVIVLAAWTRSFTFLWSVAAAFVVASVAENGAESDAWMSWSRKGTGLRPTSCQAWSTPTTMRRRGVDTLVTARRCFRTNIWPNRSECGFSRAPWNWYSSSLADRTNRATNSPR